MNTNAPTDNKPHLRRYATWPMLWALGVGAVISGDYFGWQFGLLQGGFGGLFVATLLMIVMYVCMVFSIAELSAALPFAGGFYTFARHAFGPFIAFLSGICTVIEYVLTAAVIVTGISMYLHWLIPFVPIPLWWVLGYVIFVGINVKGVSLTFKVSCVLVMLAVLVLIIFYVGAISSGSFHWHLLKNIPDAHHKVGSWFPHGFSGIIFAIPLAIWFFLGIEELPLAAEEARNPTKDMPRALIFAITTLAILALLTLFINSGVGGGANAIGHSKAPFNEGLLAVFGKGAVTDILTIVALTGLVASFHSAVYSSGRIIFALARAGYFPQWIDSTSKQETPYVALILGGAIGLCCSGLLTALSGHFVGALLLNMAVFGAVLTYAIVMCAYIKLRISAKDLQRPYKSPLGMVGAFVGIVLAVLALVSTLLAPGLRPGAWGLLGFLVLALVYYFCFAKNSLVDDY